ncbi:MAG: hypothetical protein R6W79_01730, partial [Acidimicrobiia bacterium]
MNRTTRTILVYLAVIFIVVMGFQLVFSQATQPTELSLAEFENRLAADEIGGDLVMRDRSNELVGTITSGGETTNFIMRYPGDYA